MQRFSLRSTARSWPVGALLLVGMMAGQAFGAGSISGKVSVPASRSVSPVDADGNPINGSAVRINAFNSDLHNFRAFANDDGTYKLEDLAPGTYTMVAVGLGMDPVVRKDVTVADGQNLTQDFALQESQPFKIVKSAGGKAIPLADDINSASFADAPDILINEPWQIQLDLGGTGTFLNWKPNEVSGRFRIKYSDTALHLASDVNFKTPGVNNWPDVGREIWDGNHFDLFLQSDAFDPKRTTLELDHNWQAAVRLSDAPLFKVFQNGAPPEGQDPDVLTENQSIGTYILRKVKAGGDGELTRVDYPWTLFHQASTGKGIAPPADNSFGALDLSVGASDPDVAKEEATIKNRLSWSGYFEGWRNPSHLKPVVFTPTP